ncbi:MAG: hypothetical protein K2H43_00800, partial [Clostridia bacterium]|nr:hypothetical protein [Clostridia bacterium]
MRTRSGVGKNFIFSVLAIAFVWLVWLVAYFTVRNDYVLPSIGDTFAEMGGLLASGRFWIAFGNTLIRTLWAFLFSLIAGAGLAVLARLFAGLRAFLAPLISLLRTVPTMAVILVLLLWTTPAAAPIVVSVLVLLPAVYAACLA